MTTDQQLEQFKQQLEEQHAKIQQLEQELNEVKGPTRKEKIRQEKLRSGLYDF